MDTRLRSMWRRATSQTILGEEMALIVVSDDGSVRKASFEDYVEIVKMIVSLIPPGYVTTYGSIARLLKTSPRLIGLALKSNDQPLIVPCHRVVKSDGSLGGYSYGGQSIKKKLLELEGVELDKNNRVRKQFIVDVASLIA